MGSGGTRMNGTTSDLIATSSIYSTPPFTMMVDCMYLGTPTGVCMSQLNTAGNWNGFYFAVATTGPASVTVVNNNFTAVSGGITAGMMSGRRVQVAGVWTSSTLRSAFCNGEPDAPNTTSASPAVNQNNTLVWAARHNNGVDNFGAAAILYGAFIWNVALDQSDLKTMARGVSPFTIRPGSLVEVLSLGAFPAGYKNPFFGPDIANTGLIRGTPFTPNATGFDPVSPNVLRKNAVLNRLTQPVSRIGSLVYLGQQAMNRAANW